MCEGEGREALNDRSCMCFTLSVSKHDIRHQNIFKLLPFGFHSISLVTQIFYVQRIFDNTFEVVVLRLTPILRIEQPYTIS